MKNKNHTIPKKFIVIMVALALYAVTMFIPVSEPSFADSDALVPTLSPTQTSTQAPTQTQTPSPISIPQVRTFPAAPTLPASELSMSAPLLETGLLCPVQRVYCGWLATLLLLIFTVFFGYFYLFPSLMSSNLMLRSTWVRTSAGASIRFLFAIVLLLALTALMSIRAFAVTTVPTILNYQGVLKDSGGTPITTPQSFRFSIWSDSDYNAPADFDGAGAIPPAAPGFSGYEEVQTVTPDINGFFQLQIGSVTPIPDFNIADHLYLQVEVKPAASANTAYEELDFDGIANTTDRQPIGTIPYASNADFIDNAEIGTAAGDIAVLGPGGVFDFSVLPDGTNANTFTFDVDDTGGDITLQFGTTLSETLTWNNTLLQFELSDDLSISGDLTVTGITATGDVNFSGSTQFRIREDADPNTTAACASIGELIFNTTSNELMRCTTVGIAGVATWTNVDTGGASANSEVLVFYPEYPDTVVFPDGTTNSGTLQSLYDNTNDEHYYNWTSNQGATQDMTIKFRFPLPADFVTVGDFTFRFRTGTVTEADNDVEITIFNATNETAGDPTACASDLTNGSANAWTTGTITAASIAAGCTGGTALNAGDIVEIQIQLYDNSGAGDFADIGFLQLDYTN